ncbi:hypothetical protein [Nocardia ignorata]|uniref:Uncharacterized protein n=1 Tax=Nocardia ignorata TaxID=145285 RepID=A0A4V3CMJ6_NOCIG|nr:hypothetical protein [Nocardia ignorata]TDP29834.1 hypothetical protein DFR75_112102 [Nocardia ignorata]
MITTTYSRPRAARLATGRLIRDRLLGARAVRLARALRALNGFWISGLLERGELVTVTQVLDQLGADAETIRRYASQAGKAIKRAYLAAYDGRTPTEVWKVVNGRPRQVLAYTADEPVIRDGLAAYARTAHLVAA